MMKATIFAASAAALISAANGQMFVTYSPGGDDTSVQRIDPIITPGSISGHVHQVFGGNKLSPEVSYESLQASGCTNVGSADGKGNAADKSLYWHPALYAEAKDGSGYVRIPTNGHKLYYLDVGTGTKAEPFEFPHGFRMVAGNPFNRSPNPSGAIKWTCHTSGGDIVGENGAFPKDITNCENYPYLNAEVEFPHCWNGQDFDQENPSAHVAFAEGSPRGGSCPISHPTRLPHLFMENFFNVNDVVDQIKPNTFVLAQGDNTGYGLHADFFNGWDDGAIPALMVQCPQPEWGNEDVGTCPNFKSNGATSSCKLPVSYKEDVDTPKYLPGCNPITNTSPVPQYAPAALGVSTDECNSASTGQSGSESGNGSTSSTSGASGGASSVASSSNGASSYAAGQKAVASTFATVALTSTYAAASSPSESGHGSKFGKHRHAHHGHAQARPTWMQA